MVWVVGKDGGQWEAVKVIADVKAGGAGDEDVIVFAVDGSEFSVVFDFVGVVFVAGIDVSFDVAVFS